jgi:hypothetical protein
VTRIVFDKSHFLPTVISLAIGLLIFFFGSGIIRNYGGDLIVVLFLYFLIGLFSNISRTQKAAAVLLLAVSIELFQLLNVDSANTLEELFIGTTFDIVDIGTYIVGVAAAYQIDSHL